ncbi:hypothetical protein GCM10008967_32680 [Bacillus carboniphilus]|uniref:Uncharacterized protein n=1 Tax=Bacillus carboniphilus TaxID=86663 RepID=A0ABP3GBJ5_9BACI
MTRHQCKWIVIGLFFTFFDFRLNSFNLVPDLAGWIIVIVQMGGVNPKYKSYMSARNLAVILLALSVPDLITEQDVFSSGSLYYLVSIANSILYLFFVWKLLEGVALQLKVQNWVQQSQSIWSFRKVYTILTVIVIVFSALAGSGQLSVDLILNIWAIPVIITLVLQVFLLIKLFDTRKIIEEDNPVATM